MTWMETLWQFLESPVLQALAITTGGILTALGVSVFSRTVLLRLTANTATDLDDVLVHHGRGPLALSIALGAAYYALIRFGMVPHTQFVVAGAFGTTVVGSWALAGHFIAHAGLRNALKHQHKIAILTTRTVPLFEILSRVVVWGGAAYFILIVWNIDPTAWMASAGIVGVAIGFAAKDTIANLLAGVFIIADSPYKMGDVLLLHDGIHGQVTQIGFRATRLITKDDIEIIVPNAVMANATIINQSGGPHEKVRISCKVGVAYGSDIDEVRRVLLAQTIDLQGVVSTPSPATFFQAFGASSLDFELQVWLEEPGLAPQVRNMLNERVYKAFELHNIEIPYTKYDVYLHRSEP
ncbi:MAG: MscS family membrane protein [Kiritimatiellia bacterium]|jgi:MscS family membrane protein